MANNIYIGTADVLSAENIFVSLPAREILKGVAVRACRGSITGLLGRNGSGKSTMLQAVHGTRRAADCDVFVNGVKVRRPYTRQGLINYLPQMPFIHPRTTVRQVFCDYAVSTGVVLAAFPEIADELDKRTGDLSGGMERLVAVLAVLLAPTRFTLLDEPFTGIMPLHIAALQSLLLQQKAVKGVVITDHLYRHLLSVSDTVLLMKDGQSLVIKDREDLVLHGYLAQ